MKKQAVMADLVLGFEPEIEVPGKWDLLNRYAQSGFHYLGLAIASEFSSLETAVRYIARHRAKIIQTPDQYIIAERARDIYEAKQQGKLALGFWLQGSAPLANDIHMIDVYHRLGVRQILLCYNIRNAIGDGVVEKENSGLSQFGYKVIEEMNRVGMFIDLSHAGIKTSLDAIAASRDPVIFSHSNAYALAPHIRNLTDEQIEAVAKKGGIIGINGNSLLLGAETSGAKHIVDHIDYIVKRVGHEHVSLGLDMIYFNDILAMFYEKIGNVTYPKGYVKPTTSFEPEHIDDIIATLIERQYSDDAIINILGGNFIRVVSQVWG